MQMPVYSPFVMKDSSTALLIHTLIEDGYPRNIVIQKSELFGYIKG